MSLVLIGCGQWGRNLARNFSALGVLSAIVDDSAAAAAVASALGVPILTLDEALADPGVTQAAIAAPAGLHAELAVRCLRAGRDVYVEKPLALNLAEARDIAEAAVASGRILMVGHLLRYHPVFEAVLETVRSGELGRVLHVESVRQSLGRVRTQENVFQSLAPHDLSMILAVFGAEPLVVRAMGAALITPGVADVAGCEMTFPDGGFARVRVSWLSPVKEQRLTVVCEAGSLVFDDVADWPRKLMIRRHTLGRQGAPSVTGDEPAYRDVPPGEPLLAECRHFLACCRDRVAPRSDIGEAMAVQRILCAVSEAANGGCA